jgi:hypothetical protein
VLGCESQPHRDHESMSNKNAGATPSSIPNTLRRNRMCRTASARLSRVGGKKHQRTSLPPPLARGTHWIRRSIARRSQQARALRVAACVYAPAACHARTHGRTKQHSTGDIPSLLFPPRPRLSSLSLSLSLSLSPPSNRAHSPAGKASEEVSARAVLIRASNLVPQFGLCF